MYHHGMGATGPYAVCTDSGCSPVSYDPTAVPTWNTTAYGASPGLDVLGVLSSPDQLAAAAPTPSLFNTMGSPTQQQNWYWIAGIAGAAVLLLLVLPKRGRG